MQPDHFRNLRKSMGHTQHSLAVALLMGEHGWKTVGEWERGLRAIPGPVQVAMEHLANCRPINRDSAKMLAEDAAERRNKGAQNDS